MKIEETLLKAARVLMLSFLCVLFLFGIGLVGSIVAYALAAAIEMGVLR